jgi:uncharacterized protein YbaR (Trm112 family)
MLNILACPIDKHYPLELLEFTNYGDGNGNVDDILSSTSSTSRPTNTNEYNMKDEIIIDMGLLYCVKCTRFYPIIEQIPVMLPDELRDKQKDLEFLQRWQSKIPPNILRNAMPRHL